MTIFIIFILMKTLNRNRANILLLFTRNAKAKATTEELEYYSSDDEELIGFVARDRIDGTFRAGLFDRRCVTTLHQMLSCPMLSDM